MKSTQWVAAGIALTIASATFTYHQPAHAASWLEKTLGKVLGLDGKTSQEQPNWNGRMEVPLSEQRGSVAHPAAGRPEENAAKVIEVVGVGETRGKAKEDAARNAVLKVIGSYVSADVIAQNDEIIKDEVLSLSAGYIDSMETLSESKRSDGLYSVQVRASVVSQKLVRQLKKHNVAIRPVDSTGLLAEAITKVDQRKAAKDIWLKLLETPVSKQFDTAVLGKPYTVTSSDGEITLIFRVMARWNPDFIEEATQTLKNTSVKLSEGHVGAVDMASVMGGDATRICILTRTDTQPQPERYPYCDNNFRSWDDTPTLAFADPKGNVHDRRIHPFIRGKSLQNERLSSSRGICGILPFKWREERRRNRQLEPPTCYLPYRGVVEDIEKGGWPHIRLALTDSNHKEIASSVAFLAGAYAPFSVRGLHAGFLYILSDLENERWIPVKITKEDLERVANVTTTIEGTRDSLIQSLKLAQ